MTRTLVIDGDVIVFTLSSSVSHAVDWGNDLWTVGGDLREAKQRLDGWVSELKEDLECSKAVFGFTDYSKPNWRLKILPNYKANRKGKVKPFVYPQLGAYIRETYRCFEHPGLEGDDVCGLLMTGPIIKGDKVAVSIDKDFHTIPGDHYNQDHPERGVLSVSLEDADRTHLFQALTGDRVDNYAGCPGVGPVKAERILDCPGGARGWFRVVAAYEKAGLTAADALVQARVARILRHREYVISTGTVKLWTPKV